MKVAAPVKALAAKSAVKPAPVQQPKEVFNLSSFIADGSLSAPVPMEDVKPAEDKPEAIAAPVEKPVT